VTCQPPQKSQQYERVIFHVQASPFDSAAARTNLAALNADVASFHSRYRRLPVLSHMDQLRLGLRFPGWVFFLTAFRLVVDVFFTADLLFQVGLVPSQGKKEPDT
jgi:hypothetical protein